MPVHHDIAISGRIVDVFAHRFVVETADGARLLADLGPKGVEAFALRAGDEVALTGAMKPSEVKVTGIALKGGKPVAIEHKKKEDDAKPEVALAAVRAAGFAPIGAPRRKPKHFEVLARRGDAIVEYHVEHDGTIRNEKPVVGGDDKWKAELGTAA